ncbi:MAG: FtsX-like permease family protein [Spirochaetales bacterium]|jgi:ABC-type lipoprotein release transport system permease subunit|nr:FtsX-like permease family protein [Spirochaetales bacterium]
MNFASLFELKRMAFRSLARHKAKTILTCAAIMVSVAVYIFMDSWIAGMERESRRNIINYELGAAKLQTKMYFAKKDEMPAYETFQDWETYRDILDESGYHAAPRYVFSGTLYSATGSAPILFNAVDPTAEKRMMAYTGYVELGRFIREGEFAVALGAMTAEKLKAGIPTRPAAPELEEILASELLSAADGDFIRSCYEASETKAAGENLAEGGELRFILKRNLPTGDFDRLWGLMDAIGRNDVRISTVIDLKALPDSIRWDKWVGELWPELTGWEQALLGKLYELDEEEQLYFFTGGGEDEKAAALEAMIRAGFSGAIRHTNQVIDVKVVGMVNSPDPANNFNVGYLPLDILQDEAGMMLEGQVTELLIRDKKMGAADMTSPLENPKTIRAALERGLARRSQTLPSELDVFFWMDYMEDYLGYEAMESGSSRIFSYLLFFLAFFGISNTMLLAILERTKEIGMMRALGMTTGQLYFTFMIEAGLLGILGAALGVLLGCLINIPMVKYGIDFSGMLEELGGNIGYRVAGNFRGAWKLSTIIGSIPVAAVISSLMAFFPIRGAAKKEITSSLRFE